MPVFVPYAVVPDGRRFFLEGLKWPRDAIRIAWLNLEDKARWYAAQDPMSMIDLTGNVRFQKFWLRNYVRPLKLKRFFYSLKFW